MAKDIRELFKNDNQQSNKQMSHGHEARFLDKLDQALPQKKQSNWTFLNIAASIVIVIGLGFGGYTFFKQDANPITVVDTEQPKPETNTTTKTMTLGDISPDLKKVEDYYVANINLELSKLKLTPENKELFDGYVLRLEELNAEYKSLSTELTDNGPDEHTVNALIQNLKFRLNLMYRLKEQLNQLNNMKASQG
ncbi:hypothetical protein [Olleya marilimosa]|uniref:Anti-sigma factor n=1 Tax=Olleya marilimosa TaxID=272164 RepID=A0ABR8LWT9_9FLAO|nr:hypothetical protein [Olleya marilimosa]MBD3863559.1 hypothetical protein [Olleya marilimosa]MBD3891316.1 hypothetical protein [Olleya marilimosa]